MVSKFCCSFNGDYLFNSRLQFQNECYQDTCIFSAKLNKSFCLLTCIFLFVKCKYILCLENLFPLVFFNVLSLLLGTNYHRNRLFIYTILFFYLSLDSGDVFNTNRLCVSGFVLMLFQMLSDRICSALINKNKNITLFSYHIYELRT